MNLAEKIFLEWVKPGLPALVANAYAEASIAGEPMVPFANFMENFKTKLSGVDNLSACLELLDDSMAISFGSSWQADTPQKFRSTVISHIQNSFTKAIERQQTEEEEHAQRLVIALFLEWVFTWRLVLAKNFVTEQKEILKNRPPHVPDLVHYAQLMVRRRWVEVMPMAESLIESDLVDISDKARLHAMLADILLHWMVNKTKAKKHIHLAMELSPDIGYLHDINARISMEEGNHEEALMQFNRYKSEFPKDIQPDLSLGLYYEKNENFSLAIQQYEGILLKHPGHIATHHQKLQLAYKIFADVGPRIQFIDSSTSLLLYLEPEAQYDILIATASAYEKFNDHTTAENWFRKAIETDTERPEGYNLLGAMKAKQIRESEEELEKKEYQKEAEALHATSIKLAPAHFDGYWNLILLLQQVGDYPRAIEVLKQALPLCPSFRRLIYMQQVYLFQDLKAWDDANEAFLHAVGDKDENDHIDRFIEDAVGFYKNYLKENENTDGFDALSQLNQLIDRLEQAEGTHGKEIWYRLRIEAMLSFDRTSPALLELLREATLQFPKTEYFHQEFIQLLADNPSFEKERKAVLEKAFLLFPDVSFFKDQIRQMVFGLTHEYLSSPRPLYIDFDAAISDLILKHGSNEFLPEFMEEIENFRRRMKEVYGLQIPGLQFRAYETTNASYDYYLSIDELIVVAGKKFQDDALLVQGEPEWFEALGVKTEPLSSHGLMTLMHWVSYREADKLSEQGIEMFKPEHLIFFQLEFFIWQHAVRFIKIEDEDIRHVLEREDHETAAKFLELLQTLVSCRVPLLNKEALLLRMKLGMQRGLSITQIASDILTDRNYQPLLPYSPKTNSEFTVSPKIQSTIARSLGKLKGGEWYLKITAEECQQILAAFRNANPTGKEKVLVAEDSIAWALSVMVKLEFPFLQFVTNKYPGVPNPEELIEISTE
ncbi:tetratricopeptide repeat protein [Pararhodonellum marinum]|uniref:tetratricopeptide repeat protein n=1 Tax=Pararhodonellum marinum TaxID=2755358 RepID=UPI0018903641|nr:FHIPEP family type III secretion protein [Pararhodonellum marinum]